MTLGIYDPNVSRAASRANHRSYCEGCGDSLCPGDGPLCDACEAKDRIPQDPNLECLFKLIERRIDQLRVAMYDHTASEAERLAAKSAHSTARAILEDVVQIDREAR